LNILHKHFDKEVFFVILACMTQAHWSRLSGDRKLLGNSLSAAEPQGSGRKEGFSENGTAKRICKMLKDEI
jgi:hypothetical protein